MPFWPFKRTAPVGPSVEELQEKLFLAARSGDMPTLRKACRKWGEFVGPVAEQFVASQSGIEENGKLLHAIAVCLDEDCGYPELLDHLAVPAVSSEDPLGPLQQWYAQLERRTRRLEFNALIEEGRAFFDSLEQLPAADAAKQKCVLHSRLADLLLHSGHAEAAIADYDAALQFAKQAGFVEGAVLQLRSLMETFARLGDARLNTAAEQLKQVLASTGGNPAIVDLRLAELTSDKPRCRVLYIEENRPHEIESVKQLSCEQIELQYYRPHGTLLKAQVLTEQGKDLASTGSIDQAIACFEQARATDPLDPDPTYHLAKCLLHTGRFVDAEKLFVEVETLAPGWFNCRSDRWLAHAMATGRFEDQQMQALRIASDGGLDPARRIELAKRAVEAAPDFAPLQLALGDLCRAEGQRTAAEDAYRNGLQSVEDPDTASRLHLGLASVLPLDSEERTDELRRAQKPNGNLIAAASAKLMTLPKAA